MMKLAGTRFQRVGVRFLMVAFWIMCACILFALPRCATIIDRTRTLNIFTWPTLLDAEYLKKFEKETGITLQISYYETNEELFSKLRATGGRDYDLIVPSDYLLPQLIQEELVQPLDRARLSFFDQLDPMLLDHYCDPHNKYSVPYFYALYGLAIDRRFFGPGLKEASWDMIFNPELPYPVCMTDDAREAIILATFYKFGASQLPDIAAVAEDVAGVLQAQKKRVRAYSLFGALNLLLGGSAPIAIAMCPDAARIKREYPFIDFLVPREGSFYVFDSFVISSASRKSELAYTFMNYLYRPEVMSYHASKFAFCPPLKSMRHSCDDMCLQQGLDHGAMKFFNYPISESLMNSIWIRLMATA